MTPFHADSDVPPIVKKEAYGVIVNKEKNHRHTVGFFSPRRCKLGEGSKVLHVVLNIESHGRATVRSSSGRSFSVPFGPFVPASRSIDREWVKAAPIRAAGHGDIPEQRTNSKRALFGPPICASRTFWKKSLSNKEKVPKSWTCVISHEKNIVLLFVFDFVFAFVFDFVFAFVFAFVGECDDPRMCCV